MSNTPGAQPSNPSPIDKVRAKITGKGKPVSWDLEEDEDPVIRQKILNLVLNLVERTNPNSNLAYKICHYMEADYLDLPGLPNVFPTSRKAFKKEHKAKNEGRKKVEEELRSAKTELRDMRKGLKGVPKGSVPDIEEAIVQQEAAIVSLERELNGFSKDNEYKERYPLSTKAQGRKTGVDAADWEALKSFLEKKVKKPVAEKDSNLIKNTNLLCDHLGFSATEKEALLVVILSNDTEGSFPEFLARLFSGSQKNAHTVLAKMIGVERAEISKMFQPNSPLVEKGILIPALEMDASGGSLDDDDGDSIMPAISTHLVRVLKEPDLTLESMLKQFIGEPAATHLDWDKDFAYLGETGNEMIRMMEGVRDNGAVGVNLLLYGPPGTGKTEAVKAAAKRVGLELFVVGEKSQYGGREPTRHDRITSAILAQELLADKKDAAILLDEMEDLFPSREQSLSDVFGGASEPEGPQTMSDRKDEPAGVSKVFLNRLLERNKTMTLWAANRPDRFDPAFRRRILYSIEFRIPPSDVREKIWTSVSGRHQIDLSAEEMKSLASSFVVPPGLMDNAIRHAKLSGGGMNAIKGNLRAASGLLFGNRRAIDARDEVPSHYDLRFLNTTIEASEFDLQSLGSNIRESGRRDFSMLLYGPAGTGKTQYLSYLAKLLDMDVLVKDAASLTDKYVGETEKRIAAAFEEAEERGMFLVIDECDTFLRRREDLTNNYEVSAVNTMLTCMERHKVPFGCTTNLFKNIDSAAKRRFLFKVAFDYLTHEQSRLAFAHFFRRDCPDSMKTCPKLVPADFVNVRKQTGFISGDVTPDRLARLLTLEAKARMEDQTTSLYAGHDHGFGFHKRPA